MRDILYIEHPYFLSKRENSIRLYDYMNKKESFTTLDTVEIIVVDNSQVYLSNAVINDCLDHNILIMFCDDKHSPRSLVTDDFANKKKFERLQKQLALSSKTKARIWRKIVVSKINNQADSAINTVNRYDVRNELILFGKNVIEDDRDNREAVAAKKYFRAVFGQNFRRGRFNDPINSGLNYSYALIRSIIKRELSIFGFEMSLGLHHASNENSFKFG